MARRDRRLRRCPARRVRDGRSAALVGCALAVAVGLGAGGCQETGATAATSGGKEQGDSRCASALSAISTYGPPSYRFFVGVKETAEKAKLRLLVGILDVAADATDRPQDKAVIRRTADDYRTFLDDWNDATVPPVTRLLADTDDLRSRCGS